MAYHNKFASLGDDRNFLNCGYRQSVKIKIYPLFICALALSLISLYFYSPYKQWHTPNKQMYIHICAIYMCSG